MIITRYFTYLCLVLMLVACSRPSTEDKAAESKSNANVLSVVLGSELKDMDAAMKAAAQQAGIEVNISYAGTLEMVDKVNSGEAIDAILPANGAYPSLALQTKPLAKEKLFYSRIAIGVKQAKVKALGWDKHAPTWEQIARVAKAGQFRYGMTNPITSNTGMSTLFAVASAVAHKTEDLTVAEVNQGVLKDVLSGHKLTAGSSGWLVDAYLKEQQQLDGLINYESVLLRLNQNPALIDKLTLIYPEDGVITADYPLMLLKEAQRERFNQWLAVLKGRDFQQQHLVKAFIRPSHPDVSADPALVNDTVAELSFPNQLSVIDAVLQSYQNQLRRPTTAIYVLDVSGSMDGQRMMDMKEAMNRLTQHKSSTISERLLAFHERETVILLPFSGEVYPSQRFDFLNKESVAKQSAAIQQVIASLDTRGGTAIYSALDKAYELALSEAKLQPNNLITIVLLTDGENNEGLSLLDWFNKRDRTTPQANITIRTFPIIFGEANPEEMQQVAAATGGKVFEGRQDNLAKVFREIRGYQ